MNGMNESAKDIGDLIAGGTAIGAWVSLLPELAALFTLIWTGIRIYEWARVRVLKASEKSLEELD